MLEEVIKLHRFAGISPEKALTEAGRQREAMVAADQSIIVRCFRDDLAVLIDDDFHALPPVQRPLGAAAMLRDLSKPRTGSGVPMQEGREPPPNRWTPVVGLNSQEVSDG